MTAIVVFTHQGAVVVARLSEWHAVNRFHHVPAKPGTDLEYRLIGLSDDEAAAMARKVNAAAIWAEKTCDAANPVRRDTPIRLGGNVIPLPPRLFRTHPEARA